MGKYMRKARATDDVVVMEVAESTIGVRTRAKTLALQRLQSLSSSHDATVSLTDADASCYLQLRSRRLLKVSPLRPQQTQKNPSQKTCFKQDSMANPPSPISSLGFEGSPSVSTIDKEDGLLETRGGTEAADDGFLAIEASLGENSLDCETRGRLTRESTPCSFIRDVDVVTPGSSTRETSLNEANYRSQNAFLRNIPPMYEMEDFFAHAEQQQQRQFVNKYNFDVFTDMPLPGRYEWVRV